MRFLAIGFAAVTMVSVAMAQDGTLVPPAEGQTGKAVLADIQAKVNNIQTLKADLEFDRKDDDEGDKKKKKKKKQKEAAAGGNGEGVNPAWPEPVGRDVERGPLEISRGKGAYLYLERKKSKEEFVANPSSLWKHDIDDEEAKHIPASWPVVGDFVGAALKMNVFVALEGDTIKLRGSQGVSGVPCWVLEGKSPSKLSMLGVEQKTLKMWIGKEDGIPRLIEVSGKEDTKIRLKNVQLNAAVDEKRFTFTAPEGTKTENIFGF